MSEEVECTACGREIGRGPGGLGQVAHWNKHRRDYRDEHGENTYPSKADIRDWLNNPDGFGAATIEEAQVTLAEFYVEDSP